MIIRLSKCERFVNVPELRTWQKEAKADFLTLRKLLVEVATGCGKTFYACDSLKQLTRHLPDDRILIVVPKIVILNGWLDDLYHFFDMTEIGFYYGELKEYSRITITTTASLKNIVLDLFDILVVDEVHNMKSKSLMKLLNYKSWTFKLGLSATITDKEFRHLELEKSFNYNKYTYGIGQGIKDGVLNKFNWCDVSIKLDSVTWTTYHDLVVNIKTTLAACGGFDRYLKLTADDPLKAKLNKLFSDRNKLIYNYENKFNAFLELIESNKNRKIIVFNQYNETGDKLVELLVLAGFKAQIVNSELTPKEKQKRIKAFENNEYNILITSKMFDEGYNVPSLDMAVIFSGDSTDRQITQRVGRVLRNKLYPSLIFNIYCKGTFEERNAKIHSGYFKQFANTHEVKKW